MTSLSAWTVRVGPGGNLLLERDNIHIGFNDKASLADLLRQANRTDLWSRSPAQPLDFEALHAALPEDAHTCPEYDLSPEGCWRATACTVCTIRRDEHASSPVRCAFPQLDIIDHAFGEPEKST